MATLPSVTPGDLTRCSLHWSATPYGWARDAVARGVALPYNVVVDRDAGGAPILVAGMDPQLNARALSMEMEAGVEYCASVRLRNSHGVAVSIAAMDSATPDAFGAAPIDAITVEFLCAAAAALCARYGIDPHGAESCYTHAEAALWDGYFGTGAEQRWDLCVLEPASGDLSGLAFFAPVTGARLRRRIFAYAKVLTRGRP